MKSKNNNKYKEEYFAHWLAMYDVHQDDWSKESIEQQIELYQGIEGKQEYEKLKKELEQIVQNKDLNLFLVNAGKGITLSDLEFMANTIIATET